VTATVKANNQRFKQIN